MASSRKPKPNRPRADLVLNVAHALKDVVLPGDRVVLGVSGGIDSVVLLDVLARLAPRMRFTLRALHVNHQLSPNASAWARFCRVECRARNVPCSVAKVNVARGNSIERAAREARYAAFAAARADYVALAHNLDDQVETVLLQLLRGAGVKGLSGMPFMRSLAARASVVRPLLDTPRGDIERYAKRRKLRWIEDESNLATHFTRNWLRIEVLPVIAERVPAYRETLARAARNMAEAATLLEELAGIDVDAARESEGLRMGVLRALTPARMKNVLRAAIEARGWRMPESTRLAEAARQLATTKSGARLAVNLGSCELRLHRGIVHLVAPRSCPSVDAAIPWHGEDEIALPSGVLTMKRGRGAGMSASKLGAGAVTIRQRQGGERLQPDARRPRRTVKNLLQEARIPPWQRERLPFIYCGDALACVPGVGIDCRFRAERGEASIAATWTEA